MPGSVMMMMIILLADGKSTVSLSLGVCTDEIVIVRVG